MSGSLGDYQQQITRGNTLSAIANPVVVNPLAAQAQGLDIASKNLQFQSNQFALQQSQLQPAYSSLMALRDNPNASYDDIQSALSNSARVGANIDGLVAEVGARTARGEKPGDIIRAMSLRGMPAAVQAQMMTPQPTSVDTGAGTQFGVRGAPGGATPGQFTPTNFVPGQLSPTDLMAPTNWTDSQGHLHSGTKADWLRAQQIDPNATIVSQGAPVSSSGGGGAQPAGPPPGSSVAPNQPLSQKDADLARFAQRESGNQNILSRVPVPAGYTQDQAGSGYYQIIPSTWAEGQQLAGIPPQQQTKMAMQASPQQQYQVAAALYDKYGGKPWAQSAPQGQGGGPTLSAPSMQEVPRPYQVASNAPVGPPSGQPAAQPASVQPAGVPTGRPMTPPSPYLEPQFKQGAQDYVTDQVADKTLSRRVAPLQNALTILKANPDLVTGPSADNWYQWVQGLAAATGIDVGDVHNANAYNELTKQLAMNLQQSGADPSDMARLMHEASQPNTAQGRQAIATLAAEQIGYQRMKSAQYRQFRSQHPTDANNNAQYYNQETGDWASGQDPMAYAADLLPQAELQQYIKGLNPDQQRAFGQSLANAKRLFNIKLPTQQGGQNGG